MCIGTGPTWKTCLAKLSPASSWPRRPNTSTHHDSWVKKDARIMPNPIETGVRLKARSGEIHAARFRISLRKDSDRLHKPVETRSVRSEHRPEHVRGRADRRPGQGCAGGKSLQHHWRRQHGQSKIRTARRDNVHLW